MGIPKESGAGRRRFERVLEERRAQESPEDYGRIRRGWCWGEEAFRKERLAQVEEKHGERYGDSFMVDFLPKDMVTGS
jgi:hypothetical protein